MKDQIFTQPTIIKETSHGFSQISLESAMLENREISLIGEINETTANSIIKQLLYLQKQDPNGEITMYINSRGGEVDSGMAIYDVMQTISCPVRTVCIDLAASMAGIIFVSGIQREMLRHSRIMIHDPHIMQTGGSALNLRAVSDDLMETRQIAAEILSKHTGRSVYEILTITRTDYYYRADEAIEVGLADRVITSI